MIKSRAMRWEGHAACMGKMINTHMLFVGKLEARPFAKQRCSLYGMIL
jgi:hypothetical protein